MVKNPPAMQEAWVQSLSWEDPLEKEWQPTSCLENPKDRGAWQTTVHGVVKESDRTEQLTLSLFTSLWLAHSSSLFTLQFGLVYIPPNLAFSLSQCAHVL